jgi:hypothetical protein
MDKIIENNGINKIILDIIVSKVRNGEEVFISGFGKFYPKPCPTCGSCIGIGFKSSIKLRDVLNKRG